MDFLLKVRAYIEKYNMLKTGDTVVVGVSGGADSVALLIVLSKLKSKYDIDLQAVHINHGIRGKAADADEAFVIELCKKLNVKLKVVKKDVKALAKESGLSLEEAGRKVRYEEFSNIEAKKRLVVSVAHHKNDQAETVLHNMFRGSLINGIAGIKPISIRSNYVIIRPFLDIKRDEIENWLAGQKQAFCTDDTNFENEYTRNKIRNELLPYICNNINSAAIENITRLAGAAGELTEYMNELTDEWIEKNVIFAENKEAIISLKLFGEAKSILRKNVIYNIMSRLANKSKDITYKHVDEVEGLITKKVGARLDLIYGIKAYLDYEYLHLYIEKAELKENEWVTTKGFYELKETLKDSLVETDVDVADFSINDEYGYTKFIDCDKIENSLQLRTRKTGDYIVVDKNGSRKKIKDYFIDAKIKKEYRDKVLLVADGNNIVWIVGYRLSEEYKITEFTKKIKKLSLDILN